MQILSAVNITGTSNALDSGNSMLFNETKKSRQKILSSAKKNFLTFIKHVITTRVYFESKGFQCKEITLEYGKEIHEVLWKKSIQEQRDYIVLNVSYKKVANKDNV